MVSKKLPPLRLENAGEDVCGVDRLLDRFPRFANAFVCGLLAGALLGKLRELKASTSPPAAGCCCWVCGMVGDVKPPKDPDGAWETCGWACCFGAVA